MPNFRVFISYETITNRMILLRHNHIQRPIRMHCQREFQQVQTLDCVIGLVLPEVLQIVPEGHICYQLNEVVVILVSLRVCVIGHVPDTGDESTGYKEAVRFSKSGYRKLES